MNCTANIQHAASATPGPSEEAPQAPSSKKKTASEVVHDAICIMKDKVVLFKNQMGVAHAGISWHSGVDVMPLNDEQFSKLVRRSVRKEIGLRLSKQSLAEVVAELEADAHDDDVEVAKTYHRVAPGDDNMSICIDLCDEQRQVIKVTPGQWGVAVPHDVPAFLRPPGMAAMPNPTGIKGNLEALRQFVNVRSDNDWRLLVCYLLTALRPRGPYVIALVTGTAGSSKSTFCRVMRELIDPATPASQGLPRNEHDLVINASHSHVLVFDNVRDIPPATSDALCRISTGGGFRTRQLFSDTGEVMFDVMRPLILNGIGSIATQPDLLSRSIYLELPMIRSDRRRTEEEFWSSFKLMQPSILAGLLDALSATLAVLPTIEAKLAARMADFYQWGCAIEVALGWPAGSFSKAHAENQEVIMSDSLSEHPLAQAALKCASDEEPGKATEATPAALLEILTGYADPRIVKSRRDWPQTAHALGKRLRKLEPALRVFGVHLSFSHSGNRLIQLGRLKKQ